MKIITCNICGKEIGVKEYAHAGLFVEMGSAGMAPDSSKHVAAFDKTTDVCQVCFDKIFTAMEKKFEDFVSQLRGKNEQRNPK